MNELYKQKLHELLNSETNYPRQMLYRDAFLAGCYLSKNGQKKAGWKLIKTIFATIGWENNKTLFDKVSAELRAGRENYLAGIISGHLEINKLFYK